MATAIATIFMALRESEPAESVIVSPSANRTTGASQHLKHKPDHNEDHTNCPKNRDAGNEADKKKDDTQDDHVTSTVSARVASE